jgi:hypothetical protein
MGRLCRWLKKTYAAASAKTKAHFHTMDMMNATTPGEITHMEITNHHTDNLVTIGVV